MKFHNWWNAPRTWAKVMGIDPIVSHASWMENFPWTRLAGVALPAEQGLSFSYTLDYSSPYVGSQYFSLRLDEAAFTNEIAPARTFVMEEEAAALRGDRAHAEELAGPLVRDDPADVDTFALRMMLAELARTAGETPCAE